MGTYEYSNEVKFILPSGFVFSREDDGEGDEIIKISADEYENDDGETAYKFNARIMGIHLDPEAETDEDEDAINCDNFLDEVSKRLENSKRLRISINPDAYYLNKNIPLSLFGRKIKNFSTMLMARVNDYELIHIMAVSTFNDEDDSENDAVYENMFEILKAIRINGKKLQLGTATPQYLRSAVQLSFDEENTEAIDITPNLTFKFTNGDEKTVYEYSEGSMKEVYNNRLNYAIPDKTLYPHYNSLLSTSGFGSFLGVRVVVNSSGTEYEFIGLDLFAENDEFDENQRALYRRIIANDTEGYSLDQKAKAMQKLFRVNKDVFDCHHDRECEIEHGYLHRAYMFSALRSFAWTLADLCHHMDQTPENIALSDIKRIVSFIASNDWLNYNDETYCKGLCSGSDLHVFYVPDSISKADKQQLLPSEEDIEHVKKMKERFPNYREILSEVHSLNELRKDLAYIYPAIAQLWMELKENRNYDEALIGNEADIVYAWIALAIAAEGPFFTEDGPMSCFFSWPGEEEEQAAKDANEWMNQYGKYVQKNPEIDFNGNIFVFSGLAYHSIEKDHPIVSKVIEKGGQYRSKVSGLTNYLVINPADAGASKIVAVEEQLKKGKNIKVILLEDLENALGMGEAYSDEISSKYIEPKISLADNNAENTDIDWDEYDESDESDFESFIYTLDKYIGNDKNVIIPSVIFKKINYSAFEGCSSVERLYVPDGIKEICGSAFSECGNLKQVRLPEGLETISFYLFSDCTKLEKVIIPDSVTKIEKGAFSDCSNLEYVFIPSAVNEIESGILSDSPAFICSDTADCYAKKYADANEIVFKVLNSDGSFTTTKSDIQKLEYKPKKSKGSSKTYVIEDTTLVKYNGKAWQPELPPEITVIGEGAFAENKSVHEIVIRKGVTRIEDFIIYECEGITLTIAPTVTYIGENVISSTKECRSVKVVEGSYADEFFKNYKYKLNVSYIDANETNQISKEKVTFTKEDKKLFDISGTEIKSYKGKDPNVVIPDGITEIRYDAFAGRSDIESIILPDSVQIIGSRAFKNCTGLQSINLPKHIAQIKDNIFAECTGLKNVTMHDEITIIDDSAFEGCTGLEKIVIPESVKKIGFYAFSKCSGLKEVNIPSGVTYIGSSAFNSCSNLTSIRLPDNISQIESQAFANCKNLSEINIPKSVSTIDGFTFYNTKIRHIEIPDNITKINQYAFSSCKELESVKIPASVTAIGERAFAECENLKSLVIPDSVKDIGEKVFEKCYKLADDQGFVVAAGVLYAYLGKATTVHIPESVTKIEDQAFDKTVDLKQLTIPDSVTKIGYISSDIRKNLTICAPAGCYAEQYAKETDVKFEVYLTEEQKEALRREEEERKAREKARLEEIEKQRKLEKERQRIAEEQRLAEEKLLEEQRLAEEKRIADQRKAEYDALVAEKEQLLQTIAENKGLFGEKARRRKEAKQKLEEVEAKLNEYPEFI